MGTRRWFVPIAGMLTGTAWLALWLWEQSPYGRYLDHQRWTEIGVAAAICRALPAGDIALPVLLYAGGWLLMTAAMMLPTALPLFRRFDTLVRPRADRRRLIAVLIAGYLLVWAGFGVTAHLLDMALHAAVPQSQWLVLNGWAIGAAVLAGAGLFQFSRLKYHCLDKCRTPYGFIVQHWHGPRPLRSAFQLGFDHGLYCVGCCWAIMLLMFVVGMGNVGWMLALDGSREEHALGPPSQPPARRHTDRHRRPHHRRQSVGMIGGSRRTPASISRNKNRSRRRSGPISKPSRSEAIKVTTSGRDQPNEGFAPRSD
jgi:predicted metal-binding membrane protein